MKKNKNTVIFVIIIVIVIVFLFLYPRLTAKNGKNKSSNVPCLVPNLPLVQHIHPQLTILIDDKPEFLPAGIGIGACEKVIHTHDDDATAGIIHVESQDARQYTLGDFMSVWGKSFEREGYRLEAKVDGQIAPDPKSIILKDGEKIIMNYIKL